MKSIFVFGSNREGCHGKGAALYAKLHHGAINGQATGMQGNSYAIVTKELRKDHPRVDLDEVKIGVDIFLDFAKKNPQLTFTVTEIGCGLAGFSPAQIAPLFRFRSDNVELPEDFLDVILRVYDDEIHESDDFDHDGDADET